MTGGHQLSFEHNYSFDFDCSVISRKVRSYKTENSYIWESIDHYRQWTTVRLAQSTGQLFRSFSITLYATTFASMNKCLRSASQRESQSSHISHLLWARRTPSLGFPFPEHKSSERLEFCAQNFGLFLVRPRRL